MFMLSGIFFPISNFPGWLEGIAYWFPLTRAVYIARKLSLGEFQLNFLLQLLYIAAFSALFFALASRLIHKRLIK